MQLKFIINHLNTYTMATETKSFETKMEELKGTLQNYECGFISKMEFLNQIYNIEWNMFERAAVTRILDDIIDIKLDVLQLYLTK